MSSDNGGTLDPARHMWSSSEDSQKSYALSGKIMLTAIIILFAVVVFLVILHLYARWYLLNVRRRYLDRRRNRRQRATHMIFYVDPNNPNTTATTSTPPARGLPADVLKSLPLFTYTKDDVVGVHPPLECAVCLSEFEENDKGRNLPKCNHNFHTECIDMWFESHSTCPLCRSPVEPVAFPVTALWSGRNGTSDLEMGMGMGIPESSTTSLAGRRKGLDLSAVDVTRRSELDNEFRLSSPASSFRSPGSRLLSLKRILSMNRKGGGSGGSSVSPSGTVVGNNELDIESGRYELSQQQTRLQSQPEDVKE